jgi:polyhydroxyalkanoate synthesis regulator phasin
MRHTEFRSVSKSTNDILNYLESHPHASIAEVEVSTGYTRQQVISVLYQYGFTTSSKARKKFPRLCAIGDTVRAVWKQGDLVDQAKAKEAAEKAAKKGWEAKLKKGPLPTPEQAKEVAEFAEKVAQKHLEPVPTKGQEIIRAMLKAEDDELTRLRNEVTTLRFEIAYLEKKLGIRNANAV